MTDVQQHLGLKALLVLAILSLAGPGFAQHSPKDIIAYPPLNRIETPTIVEATLKNGMKLLLVEDSQYPTIDMRAMVHTGSVYEPSDKVGLAGMTGTVMRTGGSRRFPGDELDKLLETLGAAVETGIGQTSGYVYVSLLQEDVAQGLAVLADLLMNPEFPQEKIDLAKIEQQSLISRRNDDVGQLAGREFARLIYGQDNVYARNTEYATIASITRDDLVAFHGRFFHPNNVILAAWGNFKAKDMQRQIAAAFAGWEPQQLDIPKPPSVDYQFDYSVNYIDKPDVNQSNILLGHIGTTMDNPDFPALVVMNQILSWERMFKRVRSDEGLAYSVWGYFGAEFDHPGSFSAGCQTKSESTVKAIRLMLEEIRKIQSTEVTDDELGRSKDQYLNGFVFNFDSKGKIVERQMNYAFYGFAKDFAEQVKVGVERVTKADILRVAKAYLQPDKVRILVAGRQQDFDEPLASLGQVTVIDIAIPQPAVAVAEATPEAAAKGRALLDATLAALGGKEALLRVKSARATTQVTQVTPMGDMKMAAGITIVYPDRMRLVMSTPGGEVAMVATKEQGWVVVPGQGTMPLPATQVQSLQGGLMRDPVNLAANLDQLKVQYLGTRPLNGKETEEVLINLKGYSFHLLVDPQTSLPAGTVYTDVGPQGPAEFVEAASDFRSVDGILVPMKSETTAQGQRASATETTEYLANPQVDMGLFEKQ